MLQVLLVHLLMELGLYKMPFVFPSGFCKVSVTLAGVVIFSCKGINGWVHGDFLMGECGTGNIL